jgi:hypothetical protein
MTDPETAPPATPPPATPPESARLLGYAGLLPFAALALCALFAPEALAGWARASLAHYGATILAFMGGCRWGFAAAGLGEGPTLRPLALSVAPSLLAWVALSVPAPGDLLLLAAGLGALLAADLALVREGGAPKWWPALRWPLTVGAAASCVLGAFA